MAPDHVYSILERERERDRDRDRENMERLNGFSIHFILYANNALTNK